MGLADRSLLSIMLHNGPAWLSDLSSGPDVQWTGRSEDRQCGRGKLNRPANGLSEGIICPDQLLTEAPRRTRLAFKAAALVSS